MVLTYTIYYQEFTLYHRLLVDPSPFYYLQTLIPYEIMSMLISNLRNPYQQNLCLSDTKDRLTKNQNNNEMGENNIIIYSIIFSCFVIVFIKEGKFLLSNGRKIC